MLRWIKFTPALLLILAGAVQAAPSKESLQELQERIENLKQELDKTEGAHHEAADALKQSEQAISEANRKLSELRQQQKTNASTLQQLNHKQAGLQTTIEEQQRLLGQQFYRQYLNGEQGYLRVLLEQQDPNAVERNLQYYRYVAKARAKLIEGLRQNLDKVAELNEQTQATLKEITELKTDQEKARQELQKQKAEHQSVMSQLAGKIKSQRGEISKLQRDEKRLSELMERLERIARQEAEKRAKEREAARQKKTEKKTAKKQDGGKASTKEETPKAETVATNDELPDADQDSGFFASLKGKLRLPAKGEVANKFGSPRQESGLSWKGLFIRAAEGADVRAIARGQVVFADWLRGFGNLLIVDHGSGYMSLYGNNQALLKRVGDSVQAGDQVASIGNSGGNAESGVYFELRHKSQPMDPMAWCTLK